MAAGATVASGRATRGTDMSGVTRLSALAIAPIAVLIIASAFLIVASSQNLRSNRATMLHTYDVMDTSRALLSAIQDAETGHRGYLLTERTEYLEPYRWANDEIVPLLVKLRELTGGNANQQERLETLNQLVTRRTEEFETVLQIARDNGIAAARERMLGGVGRAAMDDIRRQISDIIVEERALLAPRVAATAETETRTLTVALATMVLALLAIIVAQLVLVRRNRMLRRAELAAAREARLLQATLDNIREGIGAFDPRGALVAWNDKFFEHLRIDRKLGKTGTPLQSILDADENEPPFALAQLRHKGVSGFDRSELIFEGLIGECEVEVCAFPSDGGLIVSSVDVTARVQAEEVARQAQKMEVVGQLTGGVAHDFNNLLQVISSNLDLLLPAVKDDKKAVRRLRNAMAGATRGAGLTRQLLAFARRQPLAPQALNLGRLLTQMEDLLRRTLGERVEIETIVAGGLWNALADPTQLEQAILNLAINARDAMPEGGKLTIELSNAFLDDDYSRRNADVPPGQYVMLACTDTGSGMPPEVAARAFEPFFTTKPEGRGTGLGLSQIYGFVKQTGGHVTIYSEPGQGTTVKMYLPRTQKGDEWSGTQQMAPIEGGSETVLVVEDDDGVRAGAVEVLESLGYGVFSARNADEALVILRGGHTIDVLFTDVVMPGDIKTTELARRARELHPRIAVLFTSGYTENAIIHNRRLDPGVQLLSKPYRKEDLARKLRTVLTSAETSTEAPDVTTSIELSASSSDAASARILLVEDEVIVRMTTVDMLAELGCAVIEAGSAKEALAALDADPKIQLLLTDIGLPDMRGNALAEECLRRRPDLKVIFATGYNASGENTPDTALGVAVVGKPFTIADLKRALETAGQATAAQS